MIELLNNVGLGQRILYDDSVTEASAIDYDEVDQTLARMKEASMEYLSKALGIEDGAL